MGECSENEYANRKLLAMHYYIGLITVRKNFKTMLTVTSEEDFCKVQHILVSLQSFNNPGFTLLLLTLQQISTRCHCCININLIPLHNSIHACSAWYCFSVKRNYILLRHYAWLILKSLIPGLICFNM